VGFGFTPPAVARRIEAVSGMRRNVLHDESSRRTRASNARSKARFPAVLTTRSERLPPLSIARQIFFRKALRRCGTNSARWSAWPKVAVLKYAVSLQWRA
jgi:hypothetical protein